MGAHRQAGPSGTAAAAVRNQSEGTLAAGRAAAGKAAVGTAAAGTLAGAVQAAEGRAAHSPSAGSPAGLVRHTGQVDRMAAGTADHRAAPGCPARARRALAARSADRMPSGLARG